MATVATYKRLGKAFPTATSEVDVYQPSVNASAITSLITLCNKTTSDATIDLNVHVAGSAVAPEDSILDGTVVEAGTTRELSMALTLDHTEVISVRCGTGSSIAVNVFGTEIA